MKDLTLKKNPLAYHYTDINGLYEDADAIFKANQAKGEFNPKDVMAVVDRLNAAEQKVRYLESLLMRNG